MSIFSRRPRTRTEIIAAADKARGRGQLKKAASGYRQALQSDPADPALNVKLAPVLARLGDAEGATACFRVAAKRHLDEGFVDRAAAVNVAATSVFPREPRFRLELARLNVQRGRKADAIATLLEGGRLLAKARQPDPAAALLAKALEIEPWHLESVLALVPILARSGRDRLARELVVGAEGRHGEARRRLRWLTFRTWPSFRTFWRWLRVPG